ncbi:unnamed protein product [Acanthoscelides obtectus]|uniref:Uncharacterized protein n=1 Tax=Acanthoscelides obtectus TaxID=200917 RepID=A0A9P0PAX7_ACAOB|nr:unnamed protein product [Acanthoscelides obtectus]CAK1657556.1 Eukaryotic translation initiation factor 4 gamma 3 [Acanthoscelides obtectus]
MDRHLNGRQNMGPPPPIQYAYSTTSSQTQAIPYYFNQQAVVQRPGGITQGQPGAPAPTQSGVQSVMPSYYYSPQQMVQRPGAIPQTPGMSAPTQNPMAPVLQTAYFAYNMPTMIPRTNVVNAQPTAGTPAPPPAPVATMATMATSQSQPQTTVQKHPQRRKNALKIIDPDTGVDRLDEIFVENSHSTSGDSSARQTPQPNPSHNKEVQATFAKQVMQAISKDKEGTHLNDDQHHHAEEPVDPNQVYHMGPHGVPCTKVDPIVQTSKLQPGAKEFMSKEPPIVSANCDAEEVTLTNKLPKERESPVKSRSKRDSNNRDQKDPAKEVPVIKDGDKAAPMKQEMSSEPNNSPQPTVISKDTSKDSSSRAPEKKGQRKENANTTDPKIASPEVTENSLTAVNQQQTYTANQDVNSNLKQAKQGAARTNNPKANAPLSSTSKPIPQIPTPQPVKSSNKSHKKNELNQKGANKEGTDMDAFNDNTVTEVNANIDVNTSPAVSNDVINANVIPTPDTNTTQPPVKDSIDCLTTASNDTTIKVEPVKSTKMKIDITDIVKEKPIVMKPFVPSVESQDETDRAALSNDKVVKAKNEANAKGDTGSNFKLPYQEGQWTPWNQTGFKVYERDFLLACKDLPASRKKPDNIPDVVLADERGMPSDGRLSMGGRNDFLNPPFNSFGGKSGSQRGSMPTKRNSQSKMDNKKLSKPSVKLTISLKEDVKLHEVENAWRPARLVKGEAASDEDKKTAELYRRVRGVLNKLTPQKFDTLLSQIKGLKIDTAERLQGVIDLVFEKAVDEPNFSVAYALMCRELALMQVPTPNSTPENPEYVNFRKLLLTRCQMEFEKQSVDEGFRNEKLKQIEECTDPEKKKDLQFELEDYDTKLRKKSVGNIRFIGELFKQNMLTVKIMVRCLNNLIDNKDEESLECLCKLLTTIGKELETKNVNLSNIFTTMKNIADKKEGKVSSRIRFMLQDVIDLRNSKWIPRRQDHNPKTIDQIQKEADQEQMNIQIMNSVPATPRKDDRSNPNTLDRKGGRGRNSSSDAEGWITNTNRSRTNQFTVQSDKLKAKAPLNDEPFGSSQMFSAWNRGSVGSTMRSQAAPLGGPNIYSALENYEPEKRSLGVSRSGSRDPYIPKGPSLEQHKFDGRGSRSGSQHRSMEGPRPSEPLIVQRSAPSAPAPAPAVPPPQKPLVTEVLTEEQMERKINNCLDEFVNGNCNIDEFFQDISTFVPLPKYPMMISDCYLKVLEKSSQARLATGLLFTRLVKQGNISLNDYCSGLEDIFAQVDDLKIDIPKIWDYLAEILVEGLCEEALPLNRLHKSIAALIEQRQATNILAPLFRLVVSKKGPNFLQQIFKTSGLQLTDFMNSSDVDSFVQSNHFEFLVGGATTTGHSQMTFEQIEAMLAVFLKNKANFDDIVNWITANVGDRVKENKFIRALATAIFQDSIGPNYKLVSETLTHHNNLLLKYVDNNPKYELECLYALQALVNKMEHPQGLLLQICDKLYELGSFSQESFIAWENSKDPAEQAGKGVALKQLTSFFTQLKENDDDESSESEIA